MGLLCFFYIQIMKTSFFKWTNTQKIGVFSLLLLIILLQIVYFYIDFSPISAFSEITYETFKNEQLSSEKKKENIEIKPFNPTFLSKRIAEKLGVSPEEYQRLVVFRQSGKYINSKEDFQKVTKISDTLLYKISPYFKFPDWVLQKQKLLSEKKQLQNRVKLDINTATETDFIEVYGVGEKLSQRIVKYRQRLQGFSFKEQINEIYGLSPEVIERIWQKFEIKNQPEIVKININTASKNELLKVPYFDFKDAEAVIIYRSKVGIVKNIDELIQINEFSQEKIKKIKVYLSAETEN